MSSSEQRLIESGFPCHQVGAETRRERDTGKAPPTHRLHVWWARRPLTPSRAAILASLLPADTDPEAFVKGLGIQIQVASIHGNDWIIGEDKVCEKIVSTENGFMLPVDRVVLGAYRREQDNRTSNRQHIAALLEKYPTLDNDPVLIRWRAESNALPTIDEGETLPVRVAMGDPAWAKEKMTFTKQHKVRFAGDAYHYPRALLSNSFTSSKM